MPISATLSASSEALPVEIRINDVEALTVNQTFQSHQTRKTQVDCSALLQPGDNTLTLIIPDTFALNKNDKPYSTTSAELHLSDGNLLQVEYTSKTPGEDPEPGVVILPHHFKCPPSTAHPPWHEADTLSASSDTRDALHLVQKIYSAVTELNFQPYIDAIAPWEHQLNPRNIGIQELELTVKELRDEAWVFNPDFWPKPDQMNCHFRPHAEGRLWECLDAATGGGSPLKISRADAPLYLFKIAGTWQATSLGRFDHTPKPK